MEFKEAFETMAPLTLEQQLARDAHVVILERCRGGMVIRYRSDVDGMTWMSEVFQTDMKEGLEEFAGCLSELLGSFGDSDSVGGYLKAGWSEEDEK